MKRPLIFPLLIFLGIAFCDAQPPGPVSFDVTWRIITHGTHPLYTCRLRNDGILAKKHSTNGLPDVVLASRKLTDAETSRLERFFRDFPVEKLEKEYTNRQVEGEIHDEYDFLVRGIHKNVYVYFIKQPDLEALTREILRLVPDFGR
jgi:hypothetical protein